MSSHPESAHDFTFLRKRTLLRLLGCQRQADDAFEAWFGVRNSPHFFEGALEALEELRGRGFRLCAITDGNSRPLEIPQLVGSFDFSVTSVEAGAPKPDPRPFLLAARRAGARCSSTWR
uniref:Uncharacterized protein n=1 Tax=Alexandrium catenella TaxID=2925 RepID=A0A7S1WBU5_ALECA